MKLKMSGKKQFIKKENRYTQLTYYYNTSRKERLEKIKCECGCIVSKGNLNQHRYSHKHKILMNKPIPKCPYEHCYRKNKKHFDEYSH